MTPFVSSCQRRATQTEWGKEGRVPLEQARGDREEPLFKKYDQRRHHFVERQCWLLGRCGLRLELLVEVLRIDVQLLFDRLLRLGGGLGDLI